MNICLHNNFKETVESDSTEELNLICHPPSRGNRGFLVRGGCHGKYYINWIYLKQRIATVGAN
jgi:hypothetical protein